MENLFKIAEKWLSGLPEYLKLLVFFGILGGTFLYKKFTAKELLSFFKRKKNEHIIKKEELFEHVIFSKVSRYNRRINKIELESKDATLLFKNVLRIKYNTVIEKANEFIENEKEYKNTSRKRLSTKLLDYTDFMIEEYEKRIKDWIREKIMADSEKLNNAKLDLQEVENSTNEIFYIVLKSKKGFSTIHNKNVEWIYDLLEDFGNSKVFDSNIELLIQYFDLLKTALQSAIFHAEKIFGAFNGDLSTCINKLKQHKMWM